MNFKRYSMWVLCVFAVATASCSKKNTKDDGDVAAGGLGSSELGGASIPELPPVYFAYDSFSLDQTARSTLMGHAAWLKRNSEKKVVVEGHCDERGTTEYNLALGDRRAAAVKDFLTRNGVANSQLSTISYGEERPAVPGGDSEATWSRNRRSEFSLGQ